MCCAMGATQASVACMHACLDPKRTAPRAFCSRAEAVRSVVRAVDGLCRRMPDELREGTDHLHRVSALRRPVCAACARHASPSQSLPVAASHNALGGHTSHGTLEGSVVIAEKLSLCIPPLCLIGAYSVRCRGHCTFGPHALLG
ncbi:unspecified product [Leishmania tarentolae]|uniref:Unspecified product n=1 Tax=Leishmania tarentolae TaxID=5689 RepID=A0A640KLB0_LEITA|nr:unspecified product [Leishmania tarentolae]